MRVFPWKTFTFIKCYGVDRRTEKWNELCTVPDDKIYSAVPDEECNVRRLGPRPPK